MRCVAAILLLISLVALTAPSAGATTIRVAKDGTGDFTVIADGVLAAASGDTVSIGPGVYEETRVYEIPSDQSKVINEYTAFVQQPELTIIGDDRDSVIIGPEVPAGDLENGLAGLVGSVEASFRVQGVTIRNVSFGIDANGQWLEVSDCRLDGDYFGVFTTLTGFTTIRDCEFIEIADVGVLVLRVLGATGALVEGCTFVDNRTALDFQPPNCELRDTTFEGGIIGAQVSFGGDAVIERCSFSRHSQVGLNIGNAQAFLYDCIFDSNMAGNIDVGGFLKGSRNELAGGAIGAIRTAYSSYVEFTNNHILNSGTYTILAGNAGGPEIHRQDFTNNYWGTTDTAQIDEWIRDTNDSETNFVHVDYSPIADQPIPTESTSFGELKARYGGEK